MMRAGPTAHWSTERRPPMNPHPYLRAYLAGVFVTTLILPSCSRRSSSFASCFRCPSPLSAVSSFPCPSSPRSGDCGTCSGSPRASARILPSACTARCCLFCCCLSEPPSPTATAFSRLGATSVTWFNALSIPYALIAVVFCCGVAAYYLVWKYIVGFINRTLGIA